jgi:hypothetical protein
VYTWETSRSRPYPASAARLEKLLKTTIDVLCAPEIKVEADTITVPTSKVRQNHTTNESRYV